MDTDENQIFIQKHNWNSTIFIFWIFFSFLFLFLSASNFFILSKITKTSKTAVHWDLVINIKTWAKALQNEIFNKMHSTKILVWVTYIYLPVYAWQIFIVAKTRIKMLFQVKNITLHYVYYTTSEISRLMSLLYLIIFIYQ